MKLHPFKDERVASLQSMLEAGSFAIPRLQRAFVWNGPKAANLLDSVYRGMPIGTLTIWDTSQRNQALLRKDVSRILPAYRDGHARVWFVLDGQQRLSVLYRAHVGGEVENGKHQKIDFDRMVFRVTEGGGDAGRFVYRNPVPKEWVSIKDILAANWKTRLAGLSAGQLNRAKVCRDRLLSYRVPLVRVETDSIDSARELFVRINSAGTPIAAADRAFARAAKFDLRDYADGAWAKLPEAFKGLHHEALLQTRALLDGIDAVGSAAMESVAITWDQRIEQDPRAITRFSQVWSAQQQATARCLDLLRTKFYVLDDGLLPSQYMVSTLSVFFVHRPRQPTPGQLTEIRKWFWATALGQRYSGTGYRQNILDDAAFFAKLAQGRVVRFRLSERLNRDELLRAAYGRRSSIGDAFLCMLISQKPKYLSNGGDMQLSDFASAANRRHKHHFFPRQHLARFGIKQRAINSILNLCLVHAEENSTFGSKPPRQYLEPFRRLRHFPNVMKRHLVPLDDGSPIWEATSTGSYQGFLKARQDLACSAFERLAGAKLFRAYK
jgi:hypothetical protein